MRGAPALAACLALLVANGGAGPRAEASNGDALSGLVAHLVDHAERLLQTPGDVAIRLDGDGPARLVESLARELHARRVARAADPFAGDADAARRSGYELLIELSTDDATGGAVRARFHVTARDLWADIASARAPEATTVVYRAPAVPTGTATATPTPTPVPTTTPTPTTTPVKPTRAARRLFFRPQKSAIDLGAPLLALASGDVDDDGVVELVALTTHEVVVLAVGRDATKIEQRASLPAEAATIRPRDPVGSLVVADVGGDATPEVLARSSELAEGAIFTLRDGFLARAASLKNHPVCALRDDAGVVHVCAAMLGEGVNAFPRDGFFLEPDWKALVIPTLPPRFLAMESAALARNDGTTRTVIGAVDEVGDLRLYTAGSAAAWSTIADVGVAFEIADLDGDGEPEVIASTARPPGEGDTITVYGVSADGSTRALHRGSELRGGVVAITSGDFDDDGHVDVAAAVRLVGTTRSDLWVLQ